MTILTILYIANATLLVLHEIESAYEKEWEILKLPGGITGFILLHIPILILLFFGLIEIEKQSAPGLILGSLFGFFGIAPFIVHKFLVKTPGRFNRFISDFLIYTNIPIGICLCVLSTKAFLMAS